ncbi:MAG: ABC transporter ATP-binding protein/permease [Lachnospiraceae bacterium]|nr:ABC transporter ATP-binding protein/permease [Lachnospiraceae bacterium]
MKQEETVAPIAKKDILGKLMYILTPQQKSYGVLVLFCSLVGALFETLGVSIIYNLVQAMVNPQDLFDHPVLGPILGLFGIGTSSGAVWMTCILAALLYIVKNIYLVALIWLRNKYACKIRRELSIKIIRSYMHRDYPFFLKVTTGELLQCSRADVDGVYNIVNQLFKLIIDAATTTFIFAYIIYTDTAMALCVIALGMLCLILVTGIFRKRVRIMGKRSRESKAILNQYLLQAYNGIKEIMVKRTQPFFVDSYRKEYLRYQKTQISSNIAKESPVNLIEAVSVAGIMIALGFRMNSVTDSINFVPKLAAFALAAFRILPSLGKISSSFNFITYRSASLDKTFNTLKEVEAEEALRKKKTPVTETDEDKNLRFANELVLKDVTWHYEGIDKNVLDGLDLTIRKGTSVGIMGSSGAGKTTLMDVILSLLKPQGGRIEVDGRDVHEIPTAWARMIGYVPQSIYMTDDTIRNNVAFGLYPGEIDDEQVWRALRQAQIDVFVKDLPNGLDTKVGDRGVRFSGGQRQRIAIARALYYDPDILVFDEATSALDNETEAAVMESVDSLQRSKTLIIVAHRLSTLKNCDEIYEIHDGKAFLRDKDEIFRS